MCGLALDSFVGSIHDMPGPLHDREYAALLFTKAIRSNPAFAPAHYNLGLNHHLRARAAVGARWVCHESTV